MTTTSHDGLEKTTVRQAVKVPAGAEQPVKLPLQLKRYGYHEVELKIHSAGEIRTQKRSLAFLHPDTRERGNWEEGKGPIFGMWDWNGGHLTHQRHGSAAGPGCCSASSRRWLRSSICPRRSRISSESIGAKSFFLAYQLTMGKHSLGGKEWDPTKPAEMQEALIKWLKSQKASKPSKINQPELAVFFAEPLLGPVSYMSLPEYYGDPPYQMTAGGKGRLQEVPGPVRHRGDGHQEGVAEREMPDALGHSQFPDPVSPRKQGSDGIDGRAGHRPHSVRAHAGDAVPPGDLCLDNVAAQAGMAQDRQALAETEHDRRRLRIARPGPVPSPRSRKPTIPIRSVLLLAAFNTTRFLGWPTAVALRRRLGREALRLGAVRAACRS